MEKENKTIVNTNESVVSVTIKQLENKVINDKICFIDGIERKIVNIVCKIRKIEILEENSYKYYADDITGECVLVHYVETSENIPPLNRYLNVIGRISYIFDKTLQVIYLSPLDNSNKLCHHLMTALYIHKKFARDVPVIKEENSMQMKIDDYFKQDNANKNIVHLINLLKKCDNENGIGITTIITMLSDKLSAEEVFESIKEACSSGYIRKSKLRDHYLIST